jgi:hypothetical protein
MGRATYAGKLLRDVVQFARENKAYWLVPLVLVLGLAALLIFAGTTTAPFVYTLF